MVWSFALLTCLCVLGVLIFLLAKVYKNLSNAFIYRLLTNLCLVTIVLVSCINSSTQTKIVMMVGALFALLGNTLTELKEIVKQDQQTFFNFGKSCSNVSHVLYFFAVIIFVQNKVVTGFGWVMLAAIVFSALVSALLVKFSAEFNVNYAGSKLNIWIEKTFVMFVAISTICLSFAIEKAALFATGYIVLMVSNYLANKQQFGDKQDDTNYTVMSNVLYFVAQILIISFAYFV